MSGCDHPDRLPGLVHLIHHDVVADHELPQTRIDRFREAPTQERMFGKGLDTIEEISNDTFRGGRVVLRDEIEEFSDPIQSGIGPDNTIGHLPVAAQNTSAGLLVRNHSSLLDSGQSSVDVPEELDLFE